MKEFSLNLEAPIDGIYFSSEMIDLLSIIQCNNIEELKEFTLNCSQIDISEQEMIDWKQEKFEEIKRILFAKYKNTLLPMRQSVTDRKSVMAKTLEHAGIDRTQIDTYIQEFMSNGIEGVKQLLLAEHPEQYAKFAKKQHEFITSERDQIKSVSYEEMSNINTQLKKSNTILIGAGRYYDVTNKLYNPDVQDMEKYDFYFPRRGLDFCSRNGMHARYHTLLDKQTMQDVMTGKSKEYVLEELRAYVKKSIDFINKYNSEYKLEDGKGVISSVDLFNEIISFDPPYRNMWQELYGIDLKELMEVFEYAYEHKPEGVTYVYNEPFLENPERRKVVIELLTKMQEILPDLIDTIGTQMHIEMTQDTKAISECFSELKALEQKGMRTQITEFDMCLPEWIMFDSDGKISEKYSPEFIYDYKSKKMQEVSKAIAESGIELEGITYWSVSDTLDHNLQRTNKKTYQQALSREIATTRYAGRYAGLERKQEISMQSVVSNAIGQGISAEHVASSDKVEYREMQDQQMEGVTKDDE